ncbi:MAG: hypothetical protein CMN31_23300 [Sandaracinus sp.]|nr:hypothetical protein [Myxococcales bacterium]MAT24261.1 hypothetical protein [Sandaracinus sp.]MBJ74218.1 hypothetical protein [Sandaracinus sp.]HJK89302.1 hypothetical protein [Polyangiaceae bacterium LLY-WYZ-15_(1-7)]HJL21922.1 hypothetical protein [Polyangiaceae bacterium LLY-WYZ-15_(1-7)]
MMRLSALLLLAALVGGCDLFPKRLYLEAEDGGAFGDGGAGSALTLAETCVGEVPVVEVDEATVSIDLTELADDVNDVAACTGDATPGADGFFAVEMEAEEKWHFHVSTRSGDGFDPAIYVLDSACDARRCQPGDAIDVCGDGRDEHLTFVAPRAGTYFVGIDSRLGGPASYQLLIVRPVCGNGELEHSETCDDGNTEAGDGCDPRCRVELGAGSAGEMEPNDDFTGANLVQLEVGGDALDVSGQLASSCDGDLYAVETEGPTSLRVEMLAPGGVDCPADTTPPLALSLLDENAVTVRAVGVVEGESACPVLEASFEAGRHFVSLSTMQEDARPLAYVLRMSLTAD